MELDRKAAVQGVKVVFSLGGIVIGAFGIIATIIAYLLLSSALSDTETLLLDQYGSTILVVEDVEKTLGSASDSFESIPAATSEISTSIGSYANSTKKAGETLVELGDSFEAISAIMPTSAPESLRETGQGLIQSSESLSNASSEISGLSEGVLQVSSDLKKTKSDIAELKNSLSEARRKITSIFDLLGYSLIIFSAILILFFLALISYSIPTAL